MKILQINKFFFEKGGAERYFFDVSQALEEAGHDVIHFSMQDERNRPSPYAEYFLRPVDFSKGSRPGIGKAVHYVYSMEAMEMVRRLVKATKPDIAHLHNISHHLTPSILVALRNSGVPVVQTLHDYQLICPNYKLFTQGSPCERCKKHRYWNAVQYKCVQDSRASSTLAAFEMGFHNVLLGTYRWGVNRFIVPSQFLYTKLLEWGWRKSQSMYLPHFVKTAAAEPHTTRKRQILFAGRLVPEKGAHLVVEAAVLCPDIQFLIAGDGPQKKILEKHIADQKIKNCTLLGHLTSQALQRTIQESRAVVVPSLWYENAPYAVLEAWALDTPVIGANHGGIVELITPGKNGELFAVGNAHDLAQKVQVLFNSNVTTVSPFPFTKEKHVQQLVQLYEEIQHDTLPRRLF